MDTSKPFQTPSRWRTLAPYLAFLFGALILLFIIVGNKLQDSPGKSQTTTDPQHPADATAPTMLSNAQNPVATTDGTPTSAVSAVPDPFKAFLEAHKDIRPTPINAQPVPKSPEAIRDIFKAAVEKDISSANPFSAAHNSNNTDENTQHR